MSVADGYQALNRGSLFLDRSDRLRMRFTGPKSAELINGMVTSDVASLTPGRGQYSAALTAKGKIVADLRIFALADGLLVDTNSAASRGWSELVTKYVNPRLAPYSDVTAQTSDFTVAGAGAAALIGSLLGIDANSLKLLDPFAHVSARYDGADVTVVRTPEFGVDCYDLVVAAESASLLRSAILSAGA